MENITSDFRKWVAYNNELNSRETIRSLFHILKVAETQRLDFLRYISEHYLTPEISEKEPLPETTTQQNTR